jgi:mono/diheme cytochrome c family protein
MRNGKIIGLVSLVVGLGIATPVVLAEEHPEFTEEYLNDPVNIAVGKEIWVGQCALCHGARAYPGKAPKLKPKRYTPDFTYKRITKGFRKMPPWEDVYTLEERMALVAWIKSRKFSP